MNQKQASDLRQIFEEIRAAFKQHPVKATAATAASAGVVAGGAYGAKKTMDYVGDKAKSTWEAGKKGVTDFVDETGKAINHIDKGLKYMDSADGGADHLLYNLPFGDKLPIGYGLPVLSGVAGAGLGGIGGALLAGNKASTKKRLLAALGGAGLGGGIGAGIGALSHTQAYKDFLPLYEADKADMAKYMAEQAAHPKQSAVKVANAIKRIQVKQALAMFSKKSDANELGATLGNFFGTPGGLSNARLGGAISGGAGGAGLGALAGIPIGALLAPKNKKKERSFGNMALGGLAGGAIGAGLGGVGGYYGGRSLADSAYKDKFPGAQLMDDIMRLNPAAKQSQVKEAGPWDWAKSLLRPTRSAAPLSHEIPLATPRITKLRPNEWTPHGIDGPQMPLNTPRITKSNPGDWTHHGVDLEAPTTPPAPYIPVGWKVEDGRWVPPFEPGMMGPPAPGWPVPKPTPSGYKYLGGETPRAATNPAAAAPAAHAAGGSPYPMGGLSGKAKAGILAGGAVVAGGGAYAQNRANNQAAAAASAAAGGGIKTPGSNLYDINDILTWLKTHPELAGAGGGAALGALAPLLFKGKDDDDDNGVGKTLLGAGLGAGLGYGGGWLANNYMNAPAAPKPPAPPSIPGPPALV